MQVPKTVSLERTQWHTVPMQGHRQCHTDMYRSYNLFVFFFLFVRLFLISWRYLRFGGDIGPVEFEAILVDYITSTAAQFANEFDVPGLNTQSFGKFITGPEMKTLMLLRILWLLGILN